MRAARLAFLGAVLPVAVLAAGVEFRIADTKGHPVEDAVVSLTPLDVPVPPLHPPAEPRVIQQRGQEFSPYVTALVAGAAVSFPNRDTVQHHVYSLSPPKKFELPLYAGEAKEAIVFDRPGVISLGCNIHDWMSAYIVVLATPWFACSGADGAGAIADVPAGRYRANVWHPRLPKGESREITVTAGLAPVAFSLALKPDRRVRRAPDAGGGGYK
ncbi:MAG TPA: methylamine utilization protein [Opitutaceae bacterium]|nr:methylamine utilization protein [Opitutaceae bacterium]